VTGLASAGAAFLLYEIVIDTDSSAPQQGAAAAIAVGIAVIPYVFARAWQEMAAAVRRGTAEAPVADRSIAKLSDAAE
jgi:hypothetical protein